MTKVDEHRFPLPVFAGTSFAGMTVEDGHDSMKEYYIYLLASKRNGTLYIGVTNNLIKRVWEHRNNVIEGFTQKYNVHKLVYFGACNDAGSAITREKQIKKWNRQWKIGLIEKSNPNWKDLYPSIVS